MASLSRFRRNHSCWNLSLLESFGSSFRGWESFRRVRFIRRSHINFRALEQLAPILARWLR
jgi:hypothetical protein